MIKIEKVQIGRYKCIQKEQEVKIDSHITTIVGMNESGKTSFLTAIAKSNYFNGDPDFKYDIIQDYPRSELIDFQSSDEDNKIAEIFYSIDSLYTKQIDEEFGGNVFKVSKFSHYYTYKSDVGVFSGINANQKKYLSNLVETKRLSIATKKLISESDSIDKIPEIPLNEEDIDLKDVKESIKRIIDGSFPNWENKLEGYIAKNRIKPRIPKFWYYDDYYPLRGKININRLKSEAPKDEKDKTSLALFDLARIKPEEILQSNTKDYEKFIAMLEASSSKITQEIFKYWSTNKNLDIEFKIQDFNNPSGGLEKVLDIRVKNHRHKISLPLDRRSKGFNWFFSFIIWFSKIQSDKNSDYVLLLDEPGLNLHAAAQADLLKFIEDLSKKYQIIYTTHSPFMVDTKHLERVRTCFESDEGTIISDSVQEKDPQTLFPLQAALGYDIAQNLFISKNNLLVEGPADLIYLTHLSTLLEAEGRQHLNKEISIVPVGGLDKVSSFISLLRGSKLNIVCVLDTFTDQKGKARLDDLIRQKIVKEKNIRFFHEFIHGRDLADIEDMFEPAEYINLFNEAFKSEGTILNKDDFQKTENKIIDRINHIQGVGRFNHYRPAIAMSKLGVSKEYFSEETLARFECLFEEINKLFKSQNAAG